MVFISALPKPVSPVWNFLKPYGLDTWLATAVTLGRAILDIKIEDVSDAGRAPGCCARGLRRIARRDPGSDCERSGRLTNGGRGADQSDGVFESGKPATGRLPEP